ncbi:Putative NRPS cluster protein OS=Streptomyces glaucescens OX=1907 GN=SGLAU_04360 PE=4 SV=1 [Streptomyces glaucescens]
MDAAEAYAAGDILPPLPALPALPEQPGLPPSLDAEAAPAPGIDPAALEFLAARTAAAAHRMLADALRAEEATWEPELSVAQDAVRLAAGEPGRRCWSGWPTARSAAGRNSRPPYGPGNRAGTALSVFEEEWAVEGDALARARAALEAAWDEDERPPLRARGNRWTVVGAPGQLRLDRDGRWWPTARSAAAGPRPGGPAQDPATALASAQARPEDGAC